MSRTSTSWQAKRFFLRCNFFSFSRDERRDVDIVVINETDEVGGDGGRRNVESRM